jgi:hypothetical protein
MSKLTVVPAGSPQLHSTRRRDSWWFVAAVAAYVFWPGSIPRFFFLGAALWLACRVLTPRALAVGSAGFAAALYATTFLLTPVCALLLPARRPC